MKQVVFDAKKGTLPDGRSRRTRRSEYRRNDATWDLVENRTFVYDDWNLICEQIERPGEGAAELAYFWGPDLSGTLQGAGGVGGLVAVSIAGQFYFPGYDNNGNVIGYWDESGSLVAEYAYDAFGNTISSSGSMASVFPHRFSTKYYDAETDLYYYGYRYYTPALGRWISRDPIGEKDKSNLYLFVGNHPDLAVDYNGKVELKLYTIVENGFWNRLISGNKNDIVEVKSLSDLERIDERFRDSDYARTHASTHTPIGTSISVADGDCDIKWTLYIEYNKSLRTASETSTKIAVRPHGATAATFQDSYTKSEDGKQPPLGLIRAHEMGHARNVLENLKPCVDARFKIEFGSRTLKSSDTAKVRSIIDTCRRAKFPDESRLTKEATHNWLIQNGFTETKRIRDSLYEK